MGILDDLKLQYKLGGVAQRLIYWNIACFLISFVLPKILLLFTIDVNVLEYVSLSSNPSDFLWKPWSIISYSFFHSDFFHILFNLLVLNFASQLFLTFFTQKQFLGLYILGAVFAGIIFVASYYFLNITSAMVGASAAIMAVLVAVTVYQPLMQVRLLLIGNVKLWHIAAVLIILDLVQLRLDNMGGHISHLAGAFFGFVYIKALQNGTDMSIFITKIIDFFANSFRRQPSTPFKKVHRNYTKKPVEKRTSRIVTKDKVQQQIDEILDKISQSGYDSLTKEEKDFLFKSGK
ncbi:rhomboid family intramembrane serine protease [Flavobacterium seoulense]|uniref:Transmembrane rhomboid family protein n=1 Tax=Flavobacterium seoulense TaxID=1492738 RepID=A0A066WJZ0_9FLAO|nr:rhomboid family intramembrane serine protease [Flavobacterium seoulense]KDN54327.1 transmembrane rhomboid family protein [Flavobacterium seoulense]